MLIIYRRYPLSNKSDIIADRAHSVGHFKYEITAHYICLSIERFYSRYKSVLRPDRRKFNFEYFGISHYDQGLI